VCVNTANLIKAAINHISIKGGGTSPCHQVGHSPTNKGEGESEQEPSVAAWREGQPHLKALAWGQLWTFLASWSVLMHRARLFICLACLCAAEAVL